MENTIEERMLGAVELFHYAQKFRGQLFALILEHASFLESILSDLRVLYSAGIRTMIFCEHQGEIKTLIDRWNQCGYYFEMVSVSAEEFKSPHLRNLAYALLQRDTSPVICIEPGEENRLSREDFCRCAMEQAKSMQATKAFFPMTQTGLIVDGQFHSYPSAIEVERFLNGVSEINIGRDLLSFFHTEQRRLGLDTVVLEARKGVLFKEIFTHSGAGTLFSDDYQNVFRPARKSDVRDIALILQPYIQSGSILPINEETILDNINDWYVYTINAQVVATAKLSTYDGSVELGKLCTLPRFQGKGRARELILTLVKVAREMRKDSIFALTTSSRTADLFMKAGFAEVPRESLPEQWKSHYDFSRPSRSFRINFRDEAAAR